MKADGRVRGWLWRFSNVLPLGLWNWAVAAVGMIVSAVRGFVGFEGGLLVPVE
jgi:hypothetical protein